MERGTPTPEQIKDIYKYTFIWFEKYKHANTDDDFVNMVNEAKDIRDMFNFKFTEDLIIGLEEVIEEYHKERARG
jgi:hypothetical protein